MRTRTRIGRAAAVSCAALWSAPCFAGPITPPPGPVSPTPGPEPRIAINAVNTPGDNDSSPSVYKITQPGSYYLTGNLSGVSGKHGIEITSSGVTIDLNGFELAGVASSLDGVTCTANFRTSIEVRNGTIRNWGGDGVDFLSLTVAGGSATRVRATQNGGMGIGIGNRSTITECQANANVGDGILTGHDCTIAMCTASGNGGSGLGTSSGGTVTDCAFRENTNDGLQLGDGGNASGCTSTLNGRIGYFVGRTCTVVGCTALDNTIDGFLTSTVCTVVNCTSSDNGRDGISVDFGSTVSGCSVGLNAVDGIQASAYCNILNNQSRANGVAGFGAGIRITGNGCRIEGNNMAGNDNAVNIESSGNIIIRNTAERGPTPLWVIAAGNAYGPIVTAPSGAAVSGDSAIDASGSTHPNANFTY